MGGTGELEPNPGSRAGPGAPPRGAGRAEAGGVGEEVCCVAGECELAGVLAGYLPLLLGGQTRTLHTHLHNQAAGLNRPAQDLLRINKFPISCSCFPQNSKCDNSLIVINCNKTVV